MGELIRIGAAEGAPPEAGLGATVDTTGAWVTDLSIGEDYILFPRDLVPTGGDELKFRGGMHPCSPYFGADPDGDGPQHGYARDVEWEVLAVDANSVILEHVRKPESSHINLLQRLYYSTGMGCLLAQLNVENIGEGEIRIQPGFHPYFAGPDPKNQADLKPVEFFKSDIYTPPRATTTSTGYEVSIISREMRNRVVWSDNVAEYHCIEPVANPLTIQPGESAEYSLELSITPPWFFAKLKVDGQSGS